MPSNANHDQTDFFISYNNGDQQWALWIAWVLEQAGYKTIIQAWDSFPNVGDVTGIAEELVARLEARCRALDRRCVGA
jgi:hypothetical protein